MAIAYFPSFAHAEAIDVSFFKLQGGETVLRLLVDSGFTGDSSFVLSRAAQDVALIPAPSLHAAGAIQGVQDRVVVLCRIPALNFHASTVAILADVSALSLPSCVDGLVGLEFLRRFPRWGAEKTGDGSWRFFLES